MTLFSGGAVKYFNGFYNPRRQHTALNSKVQSLSKEKWLKRALGVAQKWAA